MSLKDVICLIPARGNSQGIPRKNEQIIGKWPLVVHSIIHAIEAGVPSSQIVVSSDSESILDIAAEYGAVPHLRPDNISDGEASTESVMLYIAESFPEYNTMLLLQPTSPIRFRGLVKKCLDKYSDGDYDSLLTTTEFYPFFWEERDKYPHLRCTTSTDDLVWKPMYNVRNRPRRQDIKSMQYFDNGNLYITDINTLKKHECRIGKKVCVYPISELEGMQIDTPDDLKMFRSVFDGTISEL